MSSSDSSSDDDDKGGPSWSFVSPDLTSRIRGRGGPGTPLVFPSGRSDEKNKTEEPSSSVKDKDNNMVFTDEEANPFLSQRSVKKDVSTVSSLSSESSAGTSFGRPMGRGRGRGVFNLQESLSKLKAKMTSESDVPMVGPLRPVENPSPISLPEKNVPDSFLDSFRREHPGFGRGRGVGQKNTIISVTEKVYVPSDVGSLPPEILEETSSLTLTSPSTSGSEIGSEDYTNIEKAVVHMSGKHGAKVVVSPNYIWLKRTKETGLYEYYVEIEPIVQSYRIKRAIMRSLEGKLGKIRNFDGSKLYLPFKLKEKKTNFSTTLPSADQVDAFTVKIKYIKECPFEDSIHFYNVLFRRIMDMLGMVEMNRHYFDYKAIFELPQHKLEIWPGVVTAVDEVEGGLMLCCDASFRVLRTQTIFDVWVNMSMSMDPSRLENEFQDYVLGKIVLTKYNNRNYRIDDIDWGHNPLSTFDFKGNQISYVDYYQAQYRITIRDYTQPLLINRPKAKQSRNYKTSGRIELICLIPELCFVSGLSEDLTSNYSVMKDVAQFTRLTPQQRHASLEKFVQKIKECKDARELLEGWGLEIENSSAVIEGRVIQPPKITLNNNFELTPVKANFTREAVSNPCFDPVTIRNWLLVCSQRDYEAGCRVVNTYRSVCQPMGIMYGADAEIVTIKKFTLDEIRNAIMKHLTKQVQFVMVIMQSQRDDLYAGIKKLCCVDRPVPSQIILSKTIQQERKLRTVMQKVALQVNCKLGGSLWTIRIPLPDRIMFIGMDVYHDPKNKSKSVTALVASINPLSTKYFSRVLFQYSHVETMSSLKPAFIEAVKAFYEENGAWPDRIVVFRDGVSDGQLNLTKEHEVVQMTSACQFLYQGKIPNFTFVVVQKRINARILLQKGLKHYENPEPGTIVDHTITRKCLFDFFLVSQLVREGTVTPTHYIVLSDTSQISPDMIQKFAYATSFMYYNWTGSIRVPAMCQYAHKLASLAGQYIKEEPSHQLCKKLFYL